MRVAADSVASWLLLPGLAAVLGCVNSAAVVPDTSFARPVPRAFATIAVLPFVGDEELRRPAEEVVAVRLREQEAVGVMPPFHVARALDAAERAREEPPPGEPGPEAWRDVVARLVGALSREEAVDADLATRARRVASRLGADAMVAGSVVSGGPGLRWGRPIQLAHARLLLVDGASGAVTTFVLRVSNPAAAELGLHEAAMDASIAAADGVLRALAARPGETPDVRAPPPPPEGDPWTTP